MNKSTKRNQANKSSVVAREQAPNANQSAQLQKVVAEFFNYGTGSDIVYFFTKMYTAAISSDEADEWSNGTRIDMANVFCALTNLVIKSEKLVK